MIDIANIPLVISWFDTATKVGGEAIGDPEHTTWGAFADVFAFRREGDKDGPNFVPARFKMEPDGRHVRRLKQNLVARTAVALDIETRKKKGVVIGPTPPMPEEAIERAELLGLACILYTSHNHRPGDPRYRMVFPLSAEIPFDLPAPEVMADLLRLTDVLDTSKIGASSVFYLPSCDDDMLDMHQTTIIPGAPIMADWIIERATALMAIRQAEQERIAEQARAEAAARRAEKIAAGFNPDDSLIEKIRSKLDLDSILTAHRYDKAGKKYRHPNSASGGYGADIKTLGGIERVFSHNGTDPLHADNLPAWCGGVTALDAVDVVTILDYGGDRTRALRELAERFNITSPLAPRKREERRALSALLFQMIRRQESQEDIITSSSAFGHELGLSREEICQVAVWVRDQKFSKKEAA